MVIYNWKGQHLLVVLNYRINEGTELLNVEQRTTQQSQKKILKRLQHIIVYTTSSLARCELLLEEAG